MRKGDRVRLSDHGRSMFRNRHSAYAEAVGTVVGFMREPHGIYVKWDHRKTRQCIHVNWLEVVGNVSMQTPLERVEWASVVLLMDAYDAQVAVSWKQGLANCAIGSANAQVVESTTKEKP